MTSPFRITPGGTAPPPAGRRRHRLAGLFASLALCALSGAAGAAPPTLLYRVDDRPPAEVFTNGLSPWGTNNNPMEHVSGRSCVERTSAFISTSASQPFVEVYTRRLRAGLAEGASFSVYIVQPNQAFYEAFATLNRIREAEPASVPIALLTLAHNQVEWFTPGSIAPTQIINAITYTRRQGEIVTTTEHNPNFADTGALPNPGPYRGFTGRPTGQWRTWLAAGVRGLLASACFQGTLTIPRRRGWPPTDL